MNCENCTNKHQDPVPYTVHDKDMARLSAANKHLIVALIIVIICFAMLAAGTVYSTIMLNNARVDALNEKIEAINELRKLESEIETVYEYEIEQDSGDGGMNNIVGRDFFYGETAHPNQENDTP